MERERNNQQQTIMIKNHDERPRNFSLVVKAQNEDLNVACQNLNTNAVNLTNLFCLFEICTTCFLV